MNSLYSYLDYRDFLKDHYSDQKERHSYFSFRFVAQKIGIDASYYAKVLNRQKHLGETYIEPLADFLGFHGREREYFITLIHFNRARSSQIEKELFSRLISLKERCGTKIPAHTYRFFSEWYIIPIRELINSSDFHGDYAALGNRLIPAISAAEAKRAVEILIELGMVAPDDSGILRQTEAVLTTGDQWRSAGIREFQKKMILNAAEALQALPAEKRDISSVTISTSFDTFEQIREKISQTRQEILEIVAADESVEQVFQLNFQLFPLAKEESCR